MRIDFVGTPVGGVDSDALQERLSRALRSDAVTVQVHEIVPPKSLIQTISKEVGTPSALEGGRLVVTDAVSAEKAARYSPFTKFGVTLTTGLPVATTDQFDAASDSEIASWIESALSLPEPEVEEDPDAFGSFDDFDDDFGDDDEDEVAPEPVSIVDTTPSQEQKPESLVTTAPAPTIPPPPMMDDDDGFETEDTLPPAPAPESVFEKREPGAHREKQASLLAPPAKETGDNSIILSDEPSPKGGGEGRDEVESLPVAKAPATPERESVIESHASNVSEVEGDMTPGQLAATQRARESRRDTGFVKPLTREEAEKDTTLRAGRTFAMAKGKRHAARVTYVTGAAGGVGKSSVSWLLADAAARLEASRKSDRAVFLIETDLRNPKYYSNLNITTGKNVMTFAEEIMSKRDAGISITKPLVYKTAIKHSHQHTMGTHSFYVLPAPYDLQSVSDSRTLETGVLLALSGLQTLSCEIFFDATELTSDTLDSFSSQLSGRSSDSVVVVGGGGRIEEVKRACQILTSTSRSIEDRKDPSSVHVIINRTSTAYAPQFQRELGRFQVRQVIPDLTKWLGDDAALASSAGGAPVSAWIGSPHIPSNVRGNLFALGVYTLTKMGYYNAPKSAVSNPAEAFESGDLNPVDKKTGKRKEGSFVKWLRGK